VAELPSTVRIGYRDFEIIEWSREEADGRKQNGMCDVDEGKLCVCSAMGPQKTAEVLLHEVLHAAWHAGNLAGKEAEERAVSGLAPQLAQIWRDNPRLVEFVTASLA